MQKMQTTLVHKLTQMIKTIWIKTKYTNNLSFTPISLPPPPPLLLYFWLTVAYPIVYLKYVLYLLTCTENVLSGAILHGTQLYHTTTQCQFHARLDPPNLTKLSNLIPFYATIICYARLCWSTLEYCTWQRCNTKSPTIYIYRHINI